MIKRMKPVIGILLILGGWSFRASGQEWFGGADLGIQVRTRRGKAIPDARVSIVYTSEEDDVGPGPVMTDNKGKAVFLDIRAGLWQVEVVHDDFLSFVASVQIQYDKKPIIQASFLQAGGRSLVPLKAKFFKVTSESASPTIGPPLAKAAIDEKPEPKLVPEPVPKPVSEPAPVEEQPMPQVAAATAPGSPMPQDHR